MVITNSETACPMNNNDYQESTERHGQWTIRQTTETPQWQWQKQVLVSWTILQKNDE